MTGAAIIGALILKNLALRPSSRVAFEGSSGSNLFCTNVRETGGITNFTSGDSLLWTKLFNFSETEQVSVPSLLDF